MPNANELPVNATETPVNWLSVAAAAAVCGISARAIQKRAARGTLAARKVEKDGASVWEIDGRELGANMDASTVHSGREPANLLPKVDAATAPARTQNAIKVDANTGANPRTDGREPSGTLPDFGAKYVAQLESENEFLRRALESAQQSEATTKAALRELARAMPKAIAAGGDSGNLEQLGTENENELQLVATDTRTPEAPISSAKARDVVTPGAASNEARNAPERGGGVTYDSIADELAQWIGRD